MKFYTVELRAEITLGEDEVGEAEIPERVAAEILLGTNLGFTVIEAEVVEVVGE